MTHRTIGLLVTLALCGLLVSRDLRAGSTGGRPRGAPILIGALNASWGSTPQVVGLRDGLVALGYQEIEQFVIGVRFTQGDLRALPTAARKLVEDRVDIIFADHDDAVTAAQQATTHIPIVFATVGDPVGRGLIQSFARPGGNLTGVADLHLELGPKRLERFREMIPGLKRVLFPYYAADAYATAEVQALRTAAHHLGLVLREQAVRTQEEAQATLAAVRSGEVDGIVAPRCCALNIPGFVLEVTTQRAIPTMFENAFWVERGALASYGPNFYASGQMAARLVDKIIKGANPAEIPVEVNSTLEFAINLKVAKALGLTLPPEVIYRADRLIR
jgi:putative tryptophan/tyrosine transport system substrate-binding protein